MLSRIFSRGFHSTWRLWDDNKVKTAKSAIKLINSSSLAKKEMNDTSLIREELPKWKIDRLALQKKFNNERWNPKKKLSRIQMESIRMLKNQFPNITALELGQQFKVSPEVIRRILKSKWQPTEEESAELHTRWMKRGQRIQKMYDEGTMATNGLPIKPNWKLTLGNTRYSGTLNLQSKRYDFPNKKTNRISDTKPYDLSKKRKGNSNQNVKKHSKLYLLKSE